MTEKTTVFIHFEYTEVALLDKQIHVYKANSVTKGKN